MSAPLLSSACFPKLGESDRRTVEEEDLMRRNTKKIKCNTTEAGRSELRIGQRSFVETLRGAYAQAGGCGKADPKDDGEMLESLKNEIQVIKHRRGKILIPEFILTDRALDKIRKPYDLSLIVKVLGRRLNIRMMTDRLQKMWAKAGTIDVTDLSNDFFVVNFSAIEDYELAILGGPWMISDCYVTVRKWRPNFDPKSEAIEDILVWVRFPDLPLEYYEEEILEAMGNEVGYTVKVDMSTSLRSRGGYARVGVQVDLRKPLLPVYILDKKERPIVYEGLHLLCYKCGRYGHTKECKEEKGSQGEEQGCEKGSEGSKEEKLYGAWTTIQGNRGFRRNGSDGRRGDLRQGNSGSRFANLANMEGVEQMEGAEQGTSMFQGKLAIPEKEWVKRRGMTGEGKDRSLEVIPVGRK